MSDAVIRDRIPPGKTRQGSLTKQWLGLPLEGPICNSCNKVLKLILPKPAISKKTVDSLIPLRRTNGVGRVGAVKKNQDKLSRMNLKKSGSLANIRGISLKLTYLSVQSFVLNSLFLCCALVLQFLNCILL